MKKLFVVMASLFFFAACEKEAQEITLISKDVSDNIKLRLNSWFIKLIIV